MNRKKYNCNEEETQNGKRNVKGRGKIKPTELIPSKVWKGF